MGRRLSNANRLPDILSACFIGLLLLCSTALAGPRDAQWKKVEDAIKQAYGMSSAQLEQAVKDYFHSQTAL